MRGGFLPPALLCAALGIALSFVSLRQALMAASLMAVIAVATWLARPAAELTELIYVGCWLSVIACAILAYWSRSLPRTSFALVAGNAGVWTGAVTAVTGQGRDLAIALPFVLLFLGGRPVIQRGGGIALKILASWLAAVAILATMVSLTPTPGYKPDHME